MLKVGSIAYSTLYGGYGKIVMHVSKNQFIMSHPKGWKANMLDMTNRESRVLTSGEHYLYCSNDTAIPVSLLKKETTC